jgi:hypothetical protein
MSGWWWAATAVGVIAMLALTVFRVLDGADVGRALVAPLAVVMMAAVPLFGREWERYKRSRLR